MFSREEIIKQVVTTRLLSYDKERDIFINNETQSIYSADVIVKIIREKMGTSFECIYDEHVSCFEVIKCTKCGTVIFERYDEDYDPNLKCPTCTGYETSFKYFTAEDIEKDEDKRKVIDTYKELARLQEEAEKRYIKRGNLYDFEKTHKKTILKNQKWKVQIQLIGFGKGDLKLEMHIWKLDGTGGGTCKHYIQIPISPSTIKVFIKSKIKCKVTWKEV